jgi:hypothetical protein
MPQNPREAALERRIPSRRALSEGEGRCFVPGFAAEAKGAGMARHKKRTELMKRSRVRRFEAQSRVESRKSKARHARNELMDAILQIVQSRVECREVETVESAKGSKGS